jgi:galactokinase
VHDRTDGTSASGIENFNPAAYARRVTVARRDRLVAALGPGSTGAPMAFLRAPARVNLIGDHTDYQDGWCLPVAIDRDVMIGFRPRRDEQVIVRSLDLAPDDASFMPVVETIAEVLSEHGRPPVGLDGVITSSVPIGSGLSSSAAFEVAVALALLSVADHAVESRVLVRALQEVERRALGVPCGPMDQTASLEGRAGCALLLDCCTLQVRPIRIPASVAVVVVHSGIERRLESSAYADRRRAAEAAAARLGLPSLRDAAPTEVAEDPFARHIVSENARVHAFAAALQARDVAACGRFMLESHASLRDDYAVSTPELDLLVDLAMDAGAFGARLTGAGFGGCIVALVAEPDVTVFVERLTQRYRAATSRPPTAFRVRAIAGAGPVT